MLTRLNVLCLGGAIVIAAVWGSLPVPWLDLAILAGFLIAASALFVHDPPKRPVIVRRVPTGYEREHSGGRSRWIPGFGVSFPLPFLPFRGWIALFRWRGRR